MWQVTYQNSGTASRTNGLPAVLPVGSQISVSLDGHCLPCRFSVAGNTTTMELAMNSRQLMASAWIESNTLSIGRSRFTRDGVWKRCSSEMQPGKHTYGRKLSLQTGRMCSGRTTLSLCTTRPVAAQTRWWSTRLARPPWG